MADTLKFDAACTTPAKKTEFAYRAQEVLQLNHNIVGKWKREGISQAEYDTLPASWKAIFKYSDKLLTEADWNKFKKDVFKPLQDIVIDGVLESRKLLPQYTDKVLFEKDWGEFKEAAKKSTTYNIDVDNMVVSK